MRDAETVSEAADRSTVGDPDRIGRFAVKRRLGAGGMGVVLVARDETLARDVAVKLVLPGRGGSDARARMIREAQAMARVAHPNVVAIYEAGVHDDGLYIAMELVQGRSLGEWLATKPPARDVLEKFVQAGRGLAAAHAAGILHRDFKPANVLVGDDGRARVLDFGLARAVSDEELAPARDLGPGLVADLTHAGTIVGTPAYMAPEQLRGEPTEKSDQWSFAVSLYRALYGAMPFKGEGLLGLMEAVVRGPAPTPPELPEVPRAITAAVMRALERDPSARWSSMTELVDAIEAELRIDPDKDPSRSRSQRRLLAWGVSVIGASSGVGMGIRAHAGHTLSLLDVFQQAVLALLAVGVGSLMLRKSVLRDAHGRRIVLLFLVVTLEMTAHRGVCLLGGDTSLVTVLRGDAIFVLLTALLAAATLERWMAWMSALMAVFLAFSFAAPDYVVPAFGTCIIGSLALTTWFWRDRSGALIRDASSSRRSTRTS